MKGEGHIEINVIRQEPPVRVVPVSCPPCRGTGRIGGLLHRDCGGRGYIEQTVRAF